MFSPGDRFDLHIDRLSVGGRGVGRKDGIVVFVDLVAAGEDVEVEVTHVKKNLIEASLVRVIEPSCHRIDPPCVHFKEGCGGCSWQHISYEEQLNAKRELVVEALRKFSGFRDIKVESTVPSPLVFRYRNRVQIHVDNGIVGFHSRGSHRIVDIKDCLITEEDLVKEFDALRRRQNAASERVQIYRNQQNQIVVENADEQSSLAFSQVNSSQNSQLIQSVLHEAEKSGTPSVILDLYAGSGNFTFPLAKKFPLAKIVGVELNKPAVENGNRKALSQNFQRVSFERAKVEEFLRKWKPPGGSYLILIDPPRTGCDLQAIKVLSQLRPTRLIYISCHPVTLARDLKLFFETGWSIEYAQPFDMFPQTDHVETVVSLTHQNH